MPNLEELKELRHSFFGWLTDLGGEGHTLNHDTVDLTLEDSDIRKALIESERFPKYYAVKGNIIVNLGFSLPDDVESDSHDLVNRYGLFIVRGHKDGSLTFDFQLMDEGTTSPEAQDEAVTLVENQKNNVRNVRVGIGVPWTFAGRPIFKGTIAFFRVTNSVEGFTTEQEFHDLEKAGTESQSILFPKDKFSVSEARTWLSSHNKSSGKVDSPARFHRFRQFDPNQCGSTPKTISFGGSGIKAVVCVRKDVTPGDVHEDQFIGSTHGKNKKKKKLTPPSQSIKYAGDCQCGCLFGETGPFSEEELEKVCGEKAKEIIEKAKLTTAARKKLPKSAFAFVDSKGVGHFPIHDKAHVRNALARVNQSPFGARALPKIRAAAKKFGIGQPTKKEENGSSFAFEVDIFKANLDRGLVYGVVYAPGVRDTHGDFTSKDEIEEAAHGFLPRSVMNIDHKNNEPEVEVVESFIAPFDFSYDGNEGLRVDKEKILKGSWVLVTKVRDPELLESIRNGERTGYSLEGTAQKV